MKSRKKYAVLVLVLVLIAWGSKVGAAGPTGTDFPHRVRSTVIKSNDIGNPRDPDRAKTIFLHSRTFRPGEGLDPALDISGLPKRPRLLMQFYHIPTTQEREELASLGVSLHQYLHYNTWFASLDKVTMPQIKKLSFIRWIGPVLPNDKILPPLKKGVPEWAINPDGTINLIVVFFKDVSPEEAEKVLNNSGAITYEGPFMLNDWVVTTFSDFISVLADENLVQWAYGK